MPVVIALPFTGLWRARNSPARRVPSHGTELLASRYAIDFIGASPPSLRSADVTDWRTLFATEPASRFAAFGRPLLAPGDGVVVTAHDGSPDHAARRSQLALVPYALAQPSRLRAGLPAIAGNFVILDLGGVFAALVHLRCGSVRVSPGEVVSTGSVLGECGNSGNSTQPHVHIQLMTTPDPLSAAPVPMAFARFRERPPRSQAFATREAAIPAENALIQPLL
ncbi:MAG TPA: M23 family metallopeptidase [Actinomycetota bacterium]